MKIPKKITIGSHTYKVRISTDLWKREGLFGSAQHNIQLIEIETGQHPEGVHISFVHELLHCVDKCYNNHALAEETIDALAEGLSQVFLQLGIKFEP